MFATAKRHGPYIIILCLLTLAVFANTLDNPFLWDDEVLIIKNAQIKSLKNIPSFFLPDYWDLHHPIKTSSQYRPIRVSSFAVDYALWKTNPTGFHFTNMALHLGNTLLFYFLLWGLARRAGMETKPGVFSLAFIAALLFAVHPIHTEAVNFIKNRSELLAFFFMLVSGILFIKILEEKKGAIGLMLWPATLLSFFFAISSKETSVVLPFVLILYGAGFLPRKQFKKLMLLTLPLFVLLLSFFMFRITAFKPPEPVENYVLGLWVHVLVVIKTLGSYLWMLVFPVNLTVERVLTIPHTLFEISILACLGSLALTGACMAKTFKRAPLVFFALGFILLTLGPVSNIHYLGARPLAEQRLYMSSAGFCLALGLGIYAMASFKKTWKIIAGALAALVFVFYCTGAYEQNKLWGDPVKLWSRAVLGAPDTYRANYNLGNAYANAEQFDLAIKHLQKALELEPMDSHALNNMANALAKTGRLEEAMPVFGDALSMDPYNYTVYFNLGNAMAEVKQPDKAVEFYEKALALSPDFAQAHNNLGSILINQGGIDKAIPHFQSALVIDPDYVNAHYNLANALAMQEKNNQALIHYQKVLELKPDDASAHYDIANLLSRLGKIQEATRHHMLALSIEPDNPRTHANLGNCLAKQGRYTEALGHYATALKLAPGDVHIHTNMGIALADAGQTDKAIKHYSMALATDPDFAPAHYNLGYVLAHQGEFDQAIIHFFKALELKPGYDLACFELGNAFAHKKQFKKAEVSYKKAIELNPDNARAWHNLGIVFAQQGRLDESIEAFLKAVSITPDYAEAIKNLQHARQIKNEESNK